MALKAQIDQQMHYYRVGRVVILDECFLLIEPQAVVVNSAPTICGSWSSS